MEALQEYATPKTKKDLRAFLGFISYYRRFVPDFATKSALFMDATSKHQLETLHWMDEMEAEFQHLKGALVESTSLHTFDPGLQTVIHTDASDRGLGAVLLQVDDEGQERLVAYFSRKLLPRQRRYSVSEKECLAVVEAVRHFEAYLLGGHFTVVTTTRPCWLYPR